ncbi:hypothetical protein ASA1KI_24590 [Opitutales bacterium ASA1]|uniref:hypothetical protein n=1 Tax=Congregicoccus parvus TaxID=3081749 RepID=UPI002B31B92E|nr:hypothetical protein ASA1KI_24590 [Opitutales bacterium ASA1]
MTQSPHSHLIDLPDSALWSGISWMDFARLSARERSATIVVLPLFGFGDWGYGQPLDLEETLGTAVLRHALERPGKNGAHVLVMPPLRFVLGPYVHNVFGIDFETAMELVHEIASGVRAAGFRKLLLFTTSPWNEELADAAGRAMRVKLGIQAFRVSLAALGLDLHPTRSVDRGTVQAAACACYRRGPDAAALSVEAATLREFRPGNFEQPGPVPMRGTLEDSIAAGEKLLAAAGRKLAALCLEIIRRPALPNDGRIAARRPADSPRSASKKA